MKISELIQAVGDENVSFQNIHTDTMEISIKGKNGLLTIATDPVHAQNMIACSLSGDTPKMLGLLLWIPRDKIPKEMK